MLNISQIIFLLFFPACIAILKQVIWSPELTHQLLGFGTFLFCIEQANMANQDLQKVAEIKKQIQDKWVCKINCVIASDSEAIPECCDEPHLSGECFVSLPFGNIFDERSTRNDEYPINFVQVLTRLDNFQRITIMTIILELMGFYLSSIWLGVGFILILIALLLFNLFAGINIHTSTENIIHDWKVNERFAVLIADIIALILVSLWILKIGDFWISWGLFGMSIIYCAIKLFFFFKSLNIVKLNQGQFNETKNQC